MGRPNLSEELLERIESRPNVMLGKPVIRGTRITVEIILEKLAAGFSAEDILENYPHLSKEDVLAALASVVNRTTAGPDSEITLKLKSTLLVARPFDELFCLPEPVLGDLAKLPFRFPHKVTKTFYPLRPVLNPGTRIDYWKDRVERSHSDLSRLVTCLQGQFCKRGPSRIWHMALERCQVVTLQLLSGQQMLVEILGFSNEKWHEIDC